MGFQGFGEGVDHDRAGHSAVSGDRDRVAGVVIDPAQDLDLAVVGEAPVGEIGLPHLIGQFRLEADVGRTRSFLGLRGDPTVTIQDAVHRRPRDPQVVVMSEMPDDLVGARVVTTGDKSVTDRHDQLHRRLGCPVRRRKWTSRAWNERGVAIGAVARDELGHPALRHVIVACHLALSAALDDDSSDDETSFRHAPTSNRVSPPTADGHSGLPRHRFPMS